MTFWVSYDCIGEVDLKPYKTKQNEQKINC